MNITKTEINLEVLEIKAMYNEDGSLDQDQAQLVVASNSDEYKQLFGIHSKINGYTCPRHLTVSTKFAGNCRLFSNICFREYIVDIGQEDDAKTILEAGTMPVGLRRRAYQKWQELNITGDEKPAMLHSDSLTFDSSDHEGRFYYVYGKDHIPDSFKCPVGEQPKTEKTNQVQ